MWAAQREAAAILGDAMDGKAFDGNVASLSPDLDASAYRRESDGAER
jgi:hypothetical protein